MIKHTLYKNNVERNDALLFLSEKISQKHFSKQIFVGTSFRDLRFFEQKFWDQFYWLYNWESVVLLNDSNGAIKILWSS